VSAGDLTVVVVYPDLLGTYGDGGNGVVLARRAAWRNLPVQLVESPSDQPLPDADLYCIGGGEDGPQVRAAESLRQDGALGRGVDRGAVVLAVCAGYQIVGRSYPGADGRARPGVGLLDVTTVKGPGPRAVGEVVAVPVDGGPVEAGERTVPGPALPTLTGFENHGGVTAVGPGARPLARVVAGSGNGLKDRTEGAWAGTVLGTYLHGPVLARNPVLADLLLGWATGGELAPLDDAEEEALRAERLSSGGRRGAGRSGAGRHLRHSTGR
jgi:lipid II isoglutaminyl synthase (glutamine-hydrolysing)